MPVIVWLVLTHQHPAALYVFVLAGISDALDGLAAKKLNTVSEFGRVIDPAADKLLLMGVYLSLMLEGLVPIWLVALVGGRDILIVAAYTLSRIYGRRISPRPSRLSKTNTGLQIILAAVILFELGYALELPYGDDVLIWAVAATTFASGWQYFARWIRSGGTMES